MKEHIVHRFDDELRHLHGQVVAMATLVLQQTQSALIRAVSGDPEAVAEIASNEKAVNDYELKIDEEAVSLIARRGPVAADLRTVMALSKMTTDLERIGDEAVILAGLAADWPGSGGLLANFRDETEWAAELLKRTVSIVDRVDVDEASEMEGSQAQLVEPFRSTISRLAALDNDGGTDAADAVLRALAVRAIERIGDHACNLCEHVVYLGRGIDVRHQAD